MSDVYLPMESVLRRVPYSKATIYRMIQNGDFPKQVKLPRGKVMWRQSDVDDWWKHHTDNTATCFTPLEDLM